MHARLLWSPVALVMATLGLVATSENFETISAPLQEPLPGLAVRLDADRPIRRLRLSADVRAARARSWDLSVNLNMRAEQQPAVVRARLGPCDAQEVGDDADEGDFDVGLMDVQRRLDVSLPIDGCDGLEPCVLQACLDLQTLDEPVRINWQAVLNDGRSSRALSVEEIEP